eukprot:207382-Rhodomonas_salina.1
MSHSEDSEVNDETIGKLHDRVQYMQYRYTYRFDWKPQKLEYHRKTAFVLLIMNENLYKMADQYYEMQKDCKAYFTNYEKWDMDSRKTIRT